MTGPIIIVDYDPLWLECFQILGARVATALGPLAARIEHVGSTAVPGLAAKPIIDIDVLLPSPADLALAVRDLATLGYEHRGDLGMPGRDAFRPPPAVFPHHLYVCSPDGPEFRRHLAFRDYLRTHPGVASAYALLKRQLAAEFGADREGYTQAKSDFVAGILLRAHAAALEHFPGSARRMI